jgi:LysM repeat protein
MFTRLSAKLLLFTVLMILPAAACSLGSSNSGDHQPTAVPTSFVVNTPIIITVTPFPTSAAQPTPIPLATATTVVVIQPCTIPVGWIPYRVAAGDTLSALARRTGTTAAQLATGNCLSNPNNIEVGQVLYIPPTVVMTDTPAATPACTLAPRLTAGSLARVLPGSSNALRSQPGTGSNSAVIGEILGGNLINVLAGPTCADGYYWWQVNYNGSIGWTAEGQGSTYWIEPQTTTCTPAPRLAINAQGRVVATSVALRNQPGTSWPSVVIGQMPLGSVFTVLGGPTCANGYYWWQVNYNGVTAWAAEGDVGGYWLELVGPTACTQITRLQAGRTGRVLPGTPNILRSQPSTGSGSVELGQISGGGLFRVIQGPQCAEGYNWWQVNYNGTVGWTAEGQGSTFWTEPLKCDQSQVSQLLPNTTARVTPGLPNRMRISPDSSAAVIGEIPGGATFLIISGPQCGPEGWLWWQVNYNGTVGWTAEGDATSFWLEPVF